MNISEHIRKFKCDYGFKPKPCKPTTEAPGTLEKILVLVSRIEAGQELWHPEDSIDYSGCDPSKIPFVGTTTKQCLKLYRRQTAERNGKYWKSFGVNS